MKMGRERNIIRWDARVALLHDQIASVERALLQIEEATTPSRRERAPQLRGELANLRKRLRALGPSPRAKMG